MPKIDKDHIRMLRGELTKVRCWHTGFAAGRTHANGLSPHVPGEDALRMTIQLLDELLK